MPEYDSKKVRSLINTAAAHRMHPGGELAVQLAEQLSMVDDVIAAANRATVDAQNLTRLAQADLQTAKDELAEARAKVAPMAVLVDGLKAIASNAKGAKAAALTTLQAAGIEMAVQTATPTPPAE